MCSHMQTSAVLQVQRLLIFRASAGEAYIGSLAARTSKSCLAAAFPAGPGPAFRHHLVGSLTL